jgi:hypothetical protein
LNRTLLYNSKLDNPRESRESLDSLELCFITSILFEQDFALQFIAGQFQEIQGIQGIQGIPGFPGIVLYNFDPFSTGLCSTIHSWTIPGNPGNLGFTHSPSS